jgi:hypothetical protein
LFYQKQIIEVRKNMKNTVCWRDKFISIGMVVFLMLLISACTPGNGPTVTRVAPTITSTNSATFIVGIAGTFTVTATGTPTPTFALTGDTLPSGVTFDNSTGVLSGTPAVGTNGTYNLTITASNGISPDATQNFTLTVYLAPAITSADNAIFHEGYARTFTFKANGTPAPTFSLTGTLPSGVTFDNTTGILSGTPAAGTIGNYPLVITASNGISPNATQNFTLTVTLTKAAMIISTNYYVWNPPTELQAGMDEVFGAGNWDQLNMDTETGTAFAPGSPYTFIYLEGSAVDGQPLINYLTAHITEIETWVNNGGSLYINAGIQNNLSVTAPFGVSIEGGYGTFTATAVDPLHPIFNGPFLPAGTTYTGIAFGMSIIDGTGITNIIVSTTDSTQSCLSSAEHGTGFILYGGMTADQFQNPQPNAHNLYMNILYYAAGM